MTIIGIIIPVVILIALIASVLIFIKDTINGF